MSDTKTSTSPVAARGVDRIFVVGAILYLLVSSFMITKFPRVWIDTGWTMIAPYTLVTEGRLANPMIPIHGFDQHILWPQIVQRLMLAGVYQVFGFGLFQSRMLSILAGLGLLSATYFFAKRYLGRVIAAVSFGVLAVDNVFFVTSRTVRADIFVALFAVTAYLLLIHAHEVRAVRFFAASGLLLGVSLYTHPNALLVAIVCPFVFLAYGGPRSFFQMNFVVFAVSCLAAFSPYVIYVCISDFGNNFQNFMGQIGMSSTSEARTLSGILSNEYHRYWNYVLFPKRFFILTTQMIVAFVFVRHGTRIERLLAFQILVFVVALPFWNSQNPTARYFILVIPALSILISAMVLKWKEVPPLRHLQEMFSGRWRASIVSIIFLLYVSNQVVGDAYVLWDHRDNNYEQFINEIRETIPPGQKVWATVSFWIGMRDYRLTTQLAPVEKILEFRPEFVILYDSDTWGGRSATVGRKFDNEEMYREVRHAMEKLCLDQGVFLKRIDNRYYGDVEIFRIEWPPNEGSTAK